MHIAPIPLGLTILGVGLLIGPVQEAYNWFFVRDPLWFFRDPAGWRRHLQSELRGVVIRAIIGLIALIIGIVGLMVF